MKPEELLVEAETLNTKNFTGGTKVKGWYLRTPNKIPKMARHLVADIETKEWFPVNHDTIKRVQRCETCGNWDERGEPYGVCLHKNCRIIKKNDDYCGSGWKEKQ